MVAKIIDLLKQDNFYNVSKDVDIAKGKYQIPYDWKSCKNLLKRM